jgi:hypothetical protein
MNLLGRHDARIAEHLQRRLDQHLLRGEEIVRRLCIEHQEAMFMRRSSALPAARALKDDDDLSLSVLVTAALSEDYFLDDLQASLYRRRLPYTREDVELLAAIACSGNGRLSDWRRLGRTRAALAATERYAREHGSDEIAPTSSS